MGWQAGLPKRGNLGMCQCPLRRHLLRISQLLNSPGKPSLVTPMVLPLFVWNYWERLKSTSAFLFLEKDDLQTQPKGFSGHFHQRIVPFSRELWSPVPSQEQQVNPKPSIHPSLSLECHRVLQAFLQSQRQVLVPNTK